MKDAKLYQARLAELGYWHCREQQGWKGVMCGGGFHTCKFVLHEPVRCENYQVRRRLRGETRIEIRNGQVVKLKSDRWL